MAVIQISNVPASPANLMGFRPVLNSVTTANYLLWPMVTTEKMSSDLMARPYPKVRRHSSLVMLNSVPLKFYTNFSAGFVPASQTIKVYSSENPRQDVTVSMTITQVVVGNQVYVEIVQNGALVDYKSYNVVIINAGVVTHVSREIVKVPSTYENRVTLEFASSRGVFHNYPYSLATLLQPQQFCVMGSMKAFEYPEEKEVYKEITTGRTRVVNATLERQIELETYYQDFFAHEALAFAFFHEEIKINGRSYTPVDGYEANSENDRDLTSGSITLSDVSFTSKTKPC